MKFILKNAAWINLIWLLLVLLFFKYYNNFYFENNESVYFIISLLIVPITILVINTIVHKKQLKKYQKSRENYQLRIKETINDEFIPSLKEITKVALDNDLIYFGNNLNGNIIVHETYIELLIKDTSVSYKYYYGKVISDYNLFDKRGYEMKDVNVLYQDLLLLIKSLLNEQLVYQESTKKHQIIYAKLLVNNNVKYLYSLKNYKKPPKIKTEYVVEL